MKHSFTSVYLSVKGVLQSRTRSPDSVVSLLISMLLRKWVGAERSAECCGLLWQLCSEWERALLPQYLLVPFRLQRFQLVSQWSRETIWTMSQFSISPPAWQRHSGSFTGVGWGVNYWKSREHTSSYPCFSVTPLGCQPGGFMLSCSSVMPDLCHLNK